MELENLEIIKEIMEDENKESIKYIAELIKHKKEQIPDTPMYVLPIDSLHGIDCTVELTFNSDNISFRIYSETEIACTEDYEKYGLLPSTVLVELSDDPTLEDYVEALTELVKQLATIQYDAFDGRFALASVNITEKANHWSILLNNDHTVLLQDYCCVCNVVTKTKTNCKHPLCIYCWSHIHKDDNDDKECPLCRGMLFIG
jgi:hypothetical protein